MSQVDPFAERKFRFRGWGTSSPLMNEAIKQAMAPSKDLISGANQGTQVLAEQANSQADATSQPTQPGYNSQTGEYAPDYTKPMFQDMPQVGTPTQPAGRYFTPKPVTPPQPEQQNASTPPPVKSIEQQREDRIQQITDRGLAQLDNPPSQYFTGDPYSTNERNRAYMDSLQDANRQNPRDSHVGTLRKIASLAAGIGTGVLSGNPLAGIGMYEQIAHRPALQEQAWKEDVAKRQGEAAKAAGATETQYLNEEQKAINKADAYSKFAKDLQGGGAANKLQTKVVEVSPGVHHYFNFNPVSGQYEDSGLTSPAPARGGRGQRNVEEMSAAITDAESKGDHVYDENGKPITVASLHGSNEYTQWNPENVGSQTRWRRGTSVNKVVNAGGITNLAPGIGGPQGAVTPIGVQTAPSVTTDRVWQVDPTTQQGRWVDMPSASTARPPVGLAPGMTSGYGVTGLPGAVQAPGGVPANIPQGQGLTPETAPNTMPSKEVQEPKKAMSQADVGFVQFLGRPKDPRRPQDTGQPGLVGMAKVLDKPGAADRVGAAIHLILDTSEPVGAGPSGGLGAGGVNLSAGSTLGNWVSGKLGLGPLASTAQTQAFNEAMRALPPDEMKLVQQYMATVAGVMALRQITRTSAYQWAARQVINEIGLPGQGGVTNSQQLYNSVDTVLSPDIDYFKNAIDPRVSGPFLDKWYAGLQNLDNLRAGGVPMGPTKSPTPATPSEGGKPQASGEDRVKVKRKSDGAPGEMSRAAYEAHKDKYEVQ